MAAISLGRRASAVLEGAAGVDILSAQEGPAHAARDAVVVGGGFEVDQRFPWLGHR